MNNDSRSDQACKQDGLFDALVSIVRPYEPGHQTTTETDISSALQILRQLLAHDPTEEKFVQSRAMKALDNLLGKVAAFCVPNASVPNVEFAHTAERCVYACHLAHYSVMMHEDKLLDAGCPESFLFLNEKQALGMIQRWYCLMMYMNGVAKCAYVRGKTSMYLLWALDKLNR